MDRHLTPPPRALEEHLNHFKTLQTISNHPKPPQTISNHYKPLQTLQTLLSKAPTNHLKTLQTSCSKSANGARLLQLTVEGEARNRGTHTTPPTSERQRREIKP